MAQFKKPMPSIAVPQLGTINTTPGPAAYDPTRDSAYDQIILGDLPAYGAYWKMNEKASSTFLDRGPNGFDAPSGGVTVNAYAGPDPGDPGGNGAPLFATAGNAFLAGGRGQFAFPDLNPFSVELWVYPMDLQSGGATIRKFGSNGGWSLGAQSNGTCSFLRGDAQNNDFTSGPTITGDVWNHVVATYDGTSMIVYANSVAGTPVASSRLLPQTDDSVVSITNLGLDSFYIAKAAVYSTALRQDEITAHFVAGTSSTWSPDPLIPGMRLPIRIPARRMLPIKFFDPILVSSTADANWESLQGLADTSSEPYEATKALADTSSEAWEATKSLVNTNQEPLEANLGILAPNPAVFSTPLIDDFNRADENPLSGGGIWTQVKTGLPRLKVVSNQAASTASGDIGSYYAPATFTDCEVYVTIATMATSGDSGGVAARLRDFSSGDTADGYLATTDSNGRLSIRKLSNYTSITLLAQTGLGVVVAGDTIGLRCIGTTLEAWLKHAGTWTLQVTTTDSSYPSGAIGLWANNSVIRFDDFGGGKDGEPLDALQGLASTKSDPLEGLLALAATKSDPLEAVVGIQQTKSGPWEALVGIAATKSDPWEALLALAATKSDPWETLISLAKSSSDAWEALVGIAKTSSESWEGLVGIAKTNSDAWEALQNIAATGLTPWEAIVGGILSTRVNSWEALLGVAATRQDTYEAIGGIASSRGDVWEATGAVSSTDVSPWEAIVGGIFSTRLNPWEANLGIAASNVEAWEALGGIASTRSDQWEASGNILVTQTASLPWDALKAIVSSASDPLDAIIGGVNSTRSGPYEALVGIAATRPDVYESLRAIQALGVSPWDATGVVYIAVSAIGQLPYDATVGMRVIPSLPFEASKNLIKTAPGPYEAQIKVLESGSSSYETLIGIRNPSQLPLETVIAVIAKLEILPWEATGRAKIITTETGLQLDGAYHSPNFERVVVPIGGTFVVLAVPSELMEGLTETGLDIGET